jgi:DNA mismatch endonuclease (patch repair protein)
MATPVEACVDREGANVLVAAVFRPSSSLASERLRKHPSRNTKPEVAVRRELFAMGLRYRIHLPVPGIPRRTIDVAFPKVRLAVYIDGCFWHGCARHKTAPRANREWWVAKISRNGMRDQETSAHLEGLGWTCLRFWEHDPPHRVAAEVASVVSALRAGRATSP